MSETIWAKIDPKWACQVATEHPNIFGYNRLNAEDIYEEVSLQELGGLVVRCLAKDYSYDEAREIATRRSVVNLSFDNPGKLTSTTWLLEGARAQKPDFDIVQQLKQRQVPTDTHGSDETWIIPTTALDVVEAVEATANHA